MLLLNDTFCAKTFSIWIALGSLECFFSPTRLFFYPVFSCLHDYLALHVYYFSRNFPSYTFISPYTCIRNPRVDKHSITEFWTVHILVKIWVGYSNVERKKEIAPLFVYRRLDHLRGLWLDVRLPIYLSGWPKNWSWPWNLTTRIRTSAVVTVGTTTIKKN